MLLCTGLFVWFPTRVMPGVNPALWSIGVEWWLSLAFPLMLVLQRRLGTERTLMRAATAGRVGAAIFVDAGGYMNAFKLRRCG